MKMEILDKKKFDEAKNMKPVIHKDAIIKELTEEKFNELLQEMESPVKFQKEIAVKIKVALDHQIDKEMREKGVLSDHTRRWVESYNKILDRIQSAIYGDKSVNLHLHKVSHSDISTKIKESVINLSSKDKK